MRRVAVISCAIVLAASAYGCYAIIETGIRKDRAIGNLVRSEFIIFPIVLCVGWGLLSTMYWIDFRRLSQDKATLLRHRTDDPIALLCLAMMLTGLCAPSLTTLVLAIFVR